MNYKNYLILLCIIISSCSDKKDFETYLKETGIELKEPYIIDSIKQDGFTDWTLESYIKITNRDKKQILDKLKIKFNFPKVKTEKEYYEQNYQKVDSIKSFVINSKYFYGIYNNRYINHNDKIEIVGYQKYDWTLDTITNEMYFIYEYE